MGVGGSLVNGVVALRAYAFDVCGCTGAWSSFQAEPKGAMGERTVEFGHR
jgi:hypothetical protein